MHLTVLTGREALNCVNSKEFQSRWKSLHGSCPWATACQHPDFVEPWYALYYEHFLPVMIFAEGNDGSLAGLLPLALHRNETRLTGAGEQQAEYQGWIQTPDADASFIVNAMRKIWGRFPGVDIFLKYLPPSIPLHWVDEQADFGKLCALRTLPRPIMRADAAAMARQRNKKNHRQNYNRLKRLGAIGFERVVEHDHFIRVFDEMCIQYDFRQAALYWNMPFSSDPAKKPFYLELHKRGLLHTTILTVGDRIAASHIGLLSDDRAVHLGITTYDPALAAHSPGNLLLAMLGVHLAAEDMPVLDLTPGGDGYKEHFATEHDSVCELMIYGDKTRRLKTEALLNVKTLLKTRLRMAGYRTADVLRAVEKLNIVKPSGLRNLVEKLRVRLTSQPCDLQHRQSAHAATLGKLRISRDCLHDVLKFDPGGSAATYWEFLGIVMKRMERSHHLYSFVQNDQLRMFCWMRMCTAEPALEVSSQLPPPSDDSIVLYDLYVHRQLDNKQLVQSFVEQLLVELKEAKPAGGVYYRGALNTDLQAVVERCGFVAEAGAPRRPPAVVWWTLEA
jgi:CelD/BcsL family acetyltransferase involved in cellulose biosynthesis